MQVGIGVQAVADQAKAIAIGVLEFVPVGQDQWAIDFPAEDKSFGSGFKASEQGHHSGEQE